MSRIYLGQGLQFPLELSKGKGITASDNSLVQQSIRLILDTPVGYRLFLPSFGSRLKELLFEPNDEVLHDMLEFLITEALDNWEKRIKVTSVDCVSDGSAVECTINYRLLQSNEVESYIYPFYTKVA